MPAAFLTRLARARQFTHGACALVDPALLGPFSSAGRASGSLAPSVGCGARAREQTHSSPFVGGARWLSFGAKLPEKGRHKEHSHPARPVVKDVHGGSAKGLAKERPSKEGPVRRTGGPAGAPGPRRTASGKYAVNGAIRANHVRVVRPDGTHSVMALADAVRQARAAGSDLMQLTSGEPYEGGVLVVCKLLKWGERAAVESRPQRPSAKQMVEVAEDSGAKEMRFTASIAEHDLQTKLRRVVSFLEGHKAVKLVVKMGSRQQAQAAGGADDQGKSPAKEAEDTLRAILERPAISERSRVVVPPQRARGEFFCLIAPSSADDAGAPESPLDDAGRAGSPRESEHRTTA